MEENIFSSEKTCALLPNVFSCFVPLFGSIFLCVPLDIIDQRCSLLIYYFAWINHFTISYMNILQNILCHIPSWTHFYTMHPYMILNNLSMACFWLHIMCKRIIFSVCTETNKGKLLHCIFFVKFYFSSFRAMCVCVWKLCGANQKKEEAEKKKEWKKNIELCGSRNGKPVKYTKIWKFILDGYKET